MEKYSVYAGEFTLAFTFPSPQEFTLCHQNIRTTA